MSLYPKGARDTLSQPRPKDRMSSASSGQMPLLYSGAAMASREAEVSSPSEQSRPPKEARSAALE